MTVFNPKLIISKLCLKAPGVLRGSQFDFLQCWRVSQLTLLSLPSPGDFSAVCMFVFSLPTFRTTRCFVPNTSATHAQEFPVSRSAEWLRLGFGERKLCYLGSGGIGKAIEITYVASFSTNSTRFSTSFLQLYVQRLVFPFVQSY